jgi:hypothetical protein
MFDGSRAFFRLICSIFLTATIFGCANIQKVGLTRDIDPRKSYVLVSCSHSGYGWVEWLSFDYERVGSSSVTQTIGTNFRALYRDRSSGILLGDNATYMAGELMLVELDPGEYQFVTWKISTDSGNRGLMLVHTEITPVEVPPKFRFHVDAGKVTYIGNIDLLLRDDRKRWEWRAKNEEKRDLELFRQRFQVSDAVKIQTRMMSEMK